VLWHGIVAKVAVPAIAAPIFALAIAAVATTLSRRATKKAEGDAKHWGVRSGQIGSSALMALAHGTNDAQKTMGVLTLALIANGTIGADAATPHWVVVACGVAIALGTFIGGWRIIRTMGKGFTNLSPTQGFASQITSSAVILTSSHFGIPLSTTYVATGSILGSGVGTKNRPVRWSLAGRVALAWVLTLPAAGVCGALAYGVASLGSTAIGVTLASLLLAAYAVVIFKRSRTDKIDAHNVNDEWGAHGEAFESLVTPSSQESVE
jgi:PiT family inorganic phosphate transporter